MTSGIDRIKEWVSEWNEGALLADGFEDAIVGISERIGRDPIVVYDKGKCIEILVEMMEPEDGGDDPYAMAVEYFEFNVIGSWMGEGTPEFITFWDSEAAK
jgi:hypothetical protein